MIPAVRQSSDVIQYGKITRQGSKYLRWIITEFLHIHLRFDPSTSISKFCRKISKGKSKKGRALVVSGNKLLKIIYLVLRERRSYYSSSMEKPR